MKSSLVVRELVSDDRNSHKNLLPSVERMIRMGKD
jgi:hypothetical protein